MGQASGAAVDRRDRLSIDEFDNEYLRPNKPIVFRGAIDHWQALQRWTPEFFAEKYDNREVPCRGPSETVLMHEYIEQLQQSTDQDPAPCLRDLSLQSDFPELLADLEPRIGYAYPDWLCSRLMPRAWIRHNDLVQLFISGRGTVIPMHIDHWMTHSIVCNVYGTNRVVLFAPDQSEKMYRRAGSDAETDYLTSGVNPWNPDLEQFPLFAEAEPYYVTVEKGDTVFIPAGWWYSTITESTCISVKSSFVNWSNWHLFVDEMVRLGHASNPVKTRLTRAYLELVGRMLRLARYFGAETGQKRKYEIRFVRA